MSVLSVPTTPWRAASDDVAVRTAGLPVSVLRTLSFDRTAARVGELAASWRWLRAEGAALSDCLYAVIRDLPATESAHRPALVGLRRAVFKVAEPSDPDVRSTCGPLLPDALGERVDTWFDRFSMWREARAGLDELLNREESARQTHVRDACTDPMFRQGLLVSSPELLDVLDRWCAGRTRRLREGKLLKLVKYLARASAKTSPFSTFMVAGLTPWREAGTEPAGQGQAEGRVVLDPPVPFLDTILDALGAHPDLAAIQRVRVNPSLTIHGGTVSFIGRGPTEPLLSGPLAPAVSACLRHLKDRPEATVTELSAALAGEGLTATEARRLVDQLVMRGMLHVSPPVDDHATDPFGALAGWLEDAPETHWADVRRDLRELANEFRTATPPADIGTYRARLTRVHATMGDLADRLGVDRPSGGLHDVALPATSAPAPEPRSWCDVLADLDVLRRWLTVFDWKVPIRASLGTWYRERFGAGTRTPLLVVYREILANSNGTGKSADESPAARTLRSLFAPSATPWSLQLADTGQERLRTLHELRERARNVTHDSAGGGVRHVDPHALEAAMRAWPQWLTAPASAGFYVQRLPGDEPAAVVNTVHAGHGRATGRLRHLAARAGSGSPRTGPDIGLPCAELGGRFGSALNVRAASTRYEIEYPYSTSGRAWQRRLRPGELDVVHDPESDLVHLWSSRLGSRISPVHLGMQGELALPPLATFLERGFAPAYLFHPSVPPLISVDELTTSTGVRRFPRVQVGHVVLQRVRWVAPAADIPVRGRFDSAGDYLLALAEWRHEHGIPDRCYIRGWTPSRELGKERKPLFVDFNSWYLTTLFDQAATSSTAVVLDEALPDPLAPGAPEHVTELYMQVRGEDSTHG